MENNAKNDLIKAAQQTERERAQAGTIVPSTELQSEGAAPPIIDLPSNSFKALSTQEQTPAMESDTE